MRIALHLHPEQTHAHRARLLYAFRVFCAVYGHEPVVDGSSVQADVAIDYRPRRTRPPSVPTLHPSNLYRPRPPHVPAPPPTPLECAGERTVLFHPPRHGSLPDWLGEVFEWVSCADEFSVRARTPVGSVPYAHSYVGRHKLNVRRPYAAIAMRLLQRALCEVAPGSPLEPLSPVPTARHFIVCTHDVDFAPLGKWGSAWRLAKNAVIATALSRSPALGLQQARHLLRLSTGGGNPLDQVPALLRGQIQRGVRASYYFLPDRRHRRDGNYRIVDPNIVEVMRSLERHGMEVGVHGSYTSLDRSAGLAAEFARVRRLGFAAEGGRQHWLRFTLDRLIPATEGAAARYDSSVGWSECIGFRAGACFPFPPYDFVHERPATFLEIPLVLMEGSLLNARIPESEWSAAADEVLAASRQYGWGGIAVLWHPTAFGGGQHPTGIGDLFWKLVDTRDQWEETWTSASAFVHAVQQRYVEVGLLPPSSSARASEVSAEAAEPVLTR